MITVILNWLLMVVTLAVLICWIAALVQWDGEKHCKPEDCDSCPFPPCEDRPINKNERKD